MLNPGCITVLSRWGSRRGQAQPPLPTLVHVRQGVIHTDLAGAVPGSRQGVIQKGGGTPT